MELELIGLATDPGSGLTPRAAARSGVHLLDPNSPFEPQYRELLKRYDRVLSLHASVKLCPMGTKARAEAPPRVRVIDTGLGSAGLGAAVQRAAELLRRGASEDLIVQELDRLKREGSFFLATGDLSTLVENRLLPPLGDRFGEALGLWALLTLKDGAFRVPPLPLPARRAPEGVASAIGRRMGGKRVRVRALLGEVAPDFRQRLKTSLEHSLNLERGTLARMDPLAKSRVGEHAVAVFAYPV